MADKFTCPRRAEDGTDDPNSPFRGAGPNQDKWLRGGMGTQRRSCSYCGSMPGDEFMAAVRDGTKIGPTDKSYKAYVGEMAGKFYFQHLSEADRRAFLAMLNGELPEAVNIGYPGHFYVLPFFIRRAGS